MGVLPLIAGEALICGLMDGDMETLGRSAGDLNSVPLLATAGRPSDMLVLLRFLPLPDLVSDVLPRLLPAAVPIPGANGLARGVDTADVLRGPSLGVACADARGVVTEVVGPLTAASGRVKSSRECGLRRRACWEAREGDMRAAAELSALELMRMMDAGVAGERPASARACSTWAVIEGDCRAEPGRGGGPMVASDSGSGDIDPPSDELCGTDRGPDTFGGVPANPEASSCKEVTSCGWGCDRADFRLVSFARVKGDWRKRAAAAAAVVGRLRVGFFAEDAG